MVRGIELFKEHFSPFSEYFTLIGGAACELTLIESGGFRATKDIDMLVLLEKMDRAFSERFRAFIVSGKYKCYVTNDDRKHFYRFIEPENKSYPPQIELLSRTLFPEHPELKYTPLAEDDYVRSMSAIILSTDYYNYARLHRVMQSGLPCLDSEALIVFKAAAYLNLKKQKDSASGFVRSSDLLKHRNDVFRLMINLSPDTRANITDTIRENLREFINLFSPDNSEWSAIIQSQGALADTPENYRRNFSLFFGL